jgi:integrase/recombinase XerD
MRRRPERRAAAPPIDVADPDGLGAALARYLEWMRMKNYSAHTVDSYRYAIESFTEWAAVRAVTRPNEVTKPILERYQRHLYHRRKTNGRPLAFKSQVTRLLPLKSFFKWLARQNVLLWNPASELELPRPERRLPKHVLNREEAERVIAQPDVNDELGLRDRAILETLYATGVRRSELVALAVSDLDIERGTLMVRLGKGKKDRMIPISERAIGWIDKYLADARPSLVVDPKVATLFLSHFGEAIAPSHLTARVRAYVEAAEIGKRGACHLFRHTMATLMLEGGADIRFVQEMLGHASLETTEIYTRVSIRKLKAIYEATHPGAKPRAARAAADAAAPPPREESGEDEARAEELLFSLAAEDDATDEA